MCFFESSVRVPLLVTYPQWFEPRRVAENVSTLDILPTMCDLVGTKPLAQLPMDGTSLLPHLMGKKGHDEAIAEYTGEGTISPLMMIRRGKWKYITCPSDGSQLYNLEADPLELHDLAKTRAKLGKAAMGEEAKDAFDKFEREASARWDFERIAQNVLYSQRKRRLVWSALKQGQFTSWDFNPQDDGREKSVLATPFFFDCVDCHHYTDHG